MTSLAVVPPSVPVRGRALDGLEAEIVSLATQLAAGSARLIGLVGEFDAAEGWREWGMRSTAHWLSWRCGLGLTAAREQVRVARALRRLPVLAAAFAAGRLSYAKVRALTRFATPATESELVMLGEHATGAQIERAVAGARRAVRAEGVRARHAARYLRVRVDDDGSLVGSFRLPPEQGAVLMHALGVFTGRVRDLNDTDPTAPADPDGGAAGGGPEGRSFADALVVVAERALVDASGQASARSADRFQLVVHASAEQLARPDDADDDGVHGPELDGGLRLHPSTARRISCDCPQTVVVDGVDGAAVHVGRRTRRVGPRLRRAVQARDRGRCRAPGCSRPAAQLHHVRHWANGGGTCLPNLISLCEHHHWLVHDGGWTLVPRTRGAWVLLGPTGVTVTDPAPAPAPLDRLPDYPVSALHAITGQWDGSRLDLPAAVDLLVPPRRPHASAEALWAGRRNHSSIDPAAVETFTRYVDELSTRTADDTAQSQQSPGGTRRV